MKRYLILLSLIGFAVLAGAATVYLQPICPEQQFGALTGLDPNRVATDPASGRKLALRRWYGYVGDPITIVMRVCDPDHNDPNLPRQRLRAWREPSGEILSLDPNGVARFEVRYTTPGWHYETVAATDEISVRMGTYAVRVTANRPPRLHDATPTPIRNTVR